MNQLTYSNLYKTCKELPSTYVVMDFETTGLSAKYEKIIEVSILKYKDNQLIDEFVTLVNPERKIPSGISKLTGITNWMVEEAPVMEELILPMLHFISNHVIVGHNIHFDLSFLKEAFATFHDTNKEIHYHYLDTMYLARNYIKEAPNHRLETLKNYLHIESISHRAKADCEVTNALYQHLKEKVSC